MAATLYQFASFPFNLWRGPPPGLIQENVELFTRPGGDGVSIRALGRWGQTFEFHAVFHYVNFVTAKFTAFRLLDFPKGLYPLKYEGINYATTFRHVYSLDYAEEVSCRSMVRIIGPNYDLPAGTELVMRLRLTPHKL